MSDQENTADRPATFREVFASNEYRAVYGASALSWFGDSMARAALTALVYQQTHSVLASGATFAISYLPWLGIGPILAAVAERYPYRRVMIICDLVRMGTMGLIALPRMPLPMMLVLLFVTSLLNPPFDAARSALLPRILTGDRYIVGVSLQATTGQAALITGYFAGGALAAYDPRLTVLLNSATFGISAFLVGLGVHTRRPALRPERRSQLLRETAQGFDVVFGRSVLRSIAVVVFCTMLFYTVPEGLAAGWAAELSGSRRDQGWMQGLIMMASPVGFVLGGLLIGRLVSPNTRRSLIRPLAALVPLALVPALASPPLPVVVAISTLVGFSAAALLPATNGLFVQALPDAFRARAFGVMQSGVQLLQGIGVFVTGALSDRFPLPQVVGAWGLLGLVVMTVAGLNWPSASEIDRSISEAKAENAAEFRGRDEPTAPSRLSPGGTGDAVPAGEVALTADQSSLDGVPGSSSAGGNPAAIAETAITADSSADGSAVAAAAERGAPAPTRRRKSGSGRPFEGPEAPQLSTASAS